LDDAAWRPISQPPTDRPWHETRATLEEIVAICRANPLAARLVALTTDFVVGSGARLATTDPLAQRAWEHPLNGMARRLYRWCDELTRTGELFVVLSRNPVDGLSYVREVPALQITAIETDPNDVERELAFHQADATLEGRTWRAAGAAGTAAMPQADQVMLHYAINRPVGETRGQSDLATLVPWLERYDLWLEDRVRINRYKGAYLWHVTLEGAAVGQIEARRALYARIPKPGSIIVSDAQERWQAVQPNIGADDVESDGKALRLMIAAGAGVPLHMLGEGEGANRATAREMATVAYRHFSHRQRVLSDMAEDVLGWIVRRAGREPGDIQVTFESVLAEDSRS
ncbi:MAG: hypothetical protein V1772_04735, partial [Chloroflexota bacterium]